MKYINSVSNPEVKYIVSLYDSWKRKIEKKCIFQGKRVIESGLEYGLKLDKIYFTKKNLNLVQDLLKIRSELYKNRENFLVQVSDHVMEKISNLTNSSGLLAIFYEKESNIDQLDSGLVLFNLANPGNVGTLIRTTASCNVKSIVIIEGVDPWSAKVIQASAGTIAFVNIFRISWQELLLIKEKKSLKLYALVVKNGANIDIVDKNNALLVIGNEANGIPKEYIDDCDYTITLKMQNNIESLNAAVAGSIALYLTFCKIK